MFYVYCYKTQKDFNASLPLKREPCGRLEVGIQLGKDFIDAALITGVKTPQVIIKEETALAVDVVARVACTGEVYRYMTLNHSIAIRDILSKFLKVEGISSRRTVKIVDYLGKTCRKEGDIFYEVSYDGLVVLSQVIEIVKEFFEKDVEYLSFSPSDIRVANIKRVCLQDSPTERGSVRVTIGMH